MIDVSIFRGQRFAMMGLGKTGLSAALALHRAGAQVTAWDDNEASRRHAESFGIFCAELSNIRRDNTDCLIWSPGIPHIFPEPHPVAQRAREQGIPMVSDIDVLIHACPRTDYIGVTGTNGKSTTTALIAHTLKEFRPTQMGGNIGIPVLDLEPLDNTGTYVLEMSSYQTELTPSFSPVGAVFLNITPDHLYRHGGLEGYVAAKKKIFANPRRTGRKPIAVIGVDTPETAQVARDVEAENVWSVIHVSTQKTLSKGVYVDHGILYECRDDGAVMIADLNSFTHLRGRHNHENIACAYAVIRQVYGYAPDKIIAAMREFGGLPHRQFLVRTIGSVAYINDSKATNADAASHALASFFHIHWIIGGQPKEGGLKGLEQYKDKIEHSYLIGEAAPQFAEWLSYHRMPFTQCGDLETAIHTAHHNAQRAGRGTVLLSPACASWDQFQSYEHRGHVFTDVVNTL